MELQQTKKKQLTKLKHMKIAIIYLHMILFPKDNQLIFIFLQKKF